MTTVQVTLPDDLAEQAREAGLLASEAVEEMLRKRLKTQAAQELFAASERIIALKDAIVMTPEQVAEEIRVMRAERRTGMHV